MDFEKKKRETYSKIGQRGQVQQLNISIRSTIVASQRWTSVRVEDKCFVPSMFFRVVLHWWDAWMNQTWLPCADQSLNTRTDAHTLLDPCAHCGAAHNYWCAHTHTHLQNISIDRVAKPSLLTDGRAELFTADLSPQSMQKDKWRTGSTKETMHVEREREKK